MPPTTRTTSERDALVERARDYARAQALAGIANWIGGVTYDDDRVVSLGDGRYVIGHLCEIGGAKWRHGDPTHYPIVFNPTTGRLQVKLPKAWRGP